MTAPTLTFTHHITDTGTHDFDLSGPAGLIRAEFVDAYGLTAASVYLHHATPPDGCDLEDCAICGQCWHDVLIGALARGLRTEWEAAGRSGVIVAEQLTVWYHQHLAGGAR